MTRHLLSAIAAMAASGALQAAPLQVATFENLPLEGTESYWWGDSEEMMSDFTDGSFTFPNYCMEAYQTWAIWCQQGKARSDTSHQQTLREAVHGHGTKS